MQNIVVQQAKINEDYTETSASILVKELEKLGIDCVFGYPGASVVSIYNELSKSQKIKHILVRHEQAALHAAEGYARTSGKAGVVLVTSGPGLTNTITGIANAYADSTPLIVLAGDVSESRRSGKIFQKVNIASLTKSCTKKTFILSKKDNIAEILNEAYTLAMSDVKGPVVISLPRNILESEFKFYANEVKKEDIKVEDYSNDINKLKTLISNAEKPIVLIGGGAINAANEVKKFVSLLRCPVVSTLMGIGIYPSSSSEYLGMIGINGCYPANSALNLSDLIISLGVSFSDRSTCKNVNFAKKSNIISINIQKTSCNLTLEIIADVKEFLSQFLLTNSNFPKHDKWKKQIEILRSETVKINNFTDKIQSSFVLETISEITKNIEPVVVTDVGQHQMLTAQYFCFNKPRKFITSGGLGTMGFGLPAAIGAYIANPKNLVLNITGDGSFQMNLQELATCREHNIPIKIIIMNNGSLGMVRQLQEKIYNISYQVEMTNPDFTKIAEAYDLYAVRVVKKDELVPAIKQALQHQGTAIVDIMINPRENI